MGKQKDETIEQGGVSHTPVKGARQEEPVKKPYEKPQIVYRAPLEAMAASCSPGGKSDVTCGVFLYS